MEQPTQAESDALRKTIRAYMDTISQVHHALAYAGWHPGRTDDLIYDIIRAKGDEMRAMHAELESLRASQQAERAVPVVSPDKAKFWAWWGPYQLPEAWIARIDLVAWHAWQAATEQADRPTTVQQAAPAGDARDTFNACHAFIAAYTRMETATADGYNVHGALSEIVAAEDGLRAAIATQQP